MNSHRIEQVKRAEDNMSGARTIFILKSIYGFSFCGPSIWNNLPYSVRTCNNILQFKKLLKTHLFREAFEET